MRPIRFCILTTFYPPTNFGGDGIHVQHLAAALADRGHEVTVLHSPEAYRTLAGRDGRQALTDAGGRGEPSQGRSTGHRHPRVRVIPIGARTGPLSPLATYLTGRPLLTRGKIERALGNGFDVLHFHNPSLLGGPGLLRMGEGIKLYTAHEQWLVCPTHVLFKYQRRICEKPQCWRCSATYGRPPQLWRSTGLLESAVSELDALIAPSRTTAHLHRRFAPLVRIEPLPNFVPEPPEVPPAPAAGDEPEPGRPYFLYAGRLERIKGVSTLLGAFERQPAADLLIAGAGGLDRSLRRAAAHLPNVRLVGRVSQEELDGLYRGAVAVLVPSLGHESFPLVPLEAFARGTPAIVRRLGALEELAEQTPAAIAYGSDLELDAALEALLTERSRRDELSERALDSYRERWTPQVHLAAYFRLIADVAARRGDTELKRAAEASAPDGPAVVREPAPRA